MVTSTTRPSRSFLEGTQLALCAAMVVAALLSANSRVQDSLFPVQILALFSLLGCGWAVYSATMITGDVFTPFNLFILASYLMHCGQIWIAACGVSSESSLLWLLDHYPVAAIVNAGWYAVLGLGILSFCGIVLLKEGRVRPNARTYRPSGEAESGVRRITIILLLASFTVRAYLDVARVSAALEHGYLSIYRIESRGFLVPLLDSSFPIALVANVISFRRHRNISRLFLVGGVAYSVASMFIIGNRGEQLISVGLLLWARHCFVEPYRRQHLKWAVLLIPITLAASAIISATRQQARLDITHASYLSEVSGQNLVLCALAEFGGTLLTPLLVFDNVPRTLPFAGGLTYLCSGLIAIPGLSHAFPWVGEYYSMSEVFNKFNLPTGGSFIAETYYNFSWYGLGCMGLIGMLMAWITNVSKQERVAASMINSITLAIVVSGLFMFVRGDMYSVTVAACKAMVVYVAAQTFGHGVSWRGKWKKGL